MDRIRAAMGEPKLNYLGYSYGSYLGAVYTSVFPTAGTASSSTARSTRTNIWYDVWRGFSYGVALRFAEFTTWAAKRNDTCGLGANAASRSGSPPPTGSTGPTPPRCF